MIIATHPYSLTLGFSVIIPILTRRGVCMLGMGGRRETTVVSYVRPPLHLYLLFASPVPLPLLPLSPHPRTIRTLWGQGGEGMGQRGWNEVNLHYFLPPLPFNSSPPISLPSPFVLPFPSGTSFSLLLVLGLPGWWRG